MKEQKDGMMDVLFNLNYNGFKFSIEAEMRILPIAVGHEIIPFEFIDEELQERLQNIGRIEDGFICNGYCHRSYFQPLELNHIITKITWYGSFVSINCSNDSITVNNPDLMAERLKEAGIDF